jgi:hypothetical protein
LLDIVIDRPKYRFRAIIKYIKDEKRQETIIYANTREEAWMLSNKKISELGG